MDFLADERQNLSQKSKRCRVDEHDRWAELSVVYWDRYAVGSGHSVSSCFAEILKDSD